MLPAQDYVVSAEDKIPGRSAVLAANRRSYFMGTASGSQDSQPYHLDPTRNKVESVINHFNKGESQDAVRELKALEQMDNHGTGPVWQRHIALINAGVDLSKLGMADADQILGVDGDGSLITADKKLMREQFRSPDSLAIKHQNMIMPMFPAIEGAMPPADPLLDQMINTRLYKERLAKSNEMLSNSEPQDKSAEQVKSIIQDFNSGNLVKGAEALKRLQSEDGKVEPELWTRHIAAINANIDLKKMGMNGASQILSVDERGRLITANADLSKEQVRSTDAPGKVLEERDLKTSSFYGLPFTHKGDATLYSQATEVQSLLQEADEAHKPLTPGDHRLSFTTSSGEQREFDVHVPPGYDPSKPMPAFYVLHNALMGGDVAHGEMEHETQINEKADKQGFVVVYPIAETHENDANTILGSKFQYHSWNSRGAGMNVTYGNYDDVDYIKEASNLVDSKLNIDKSARYLLGFSEGGEFAPHVAAGMPGYWAGVGVWHPTRLGTERAPDGDALVYAQITSEKDGMLPRYGGTTDMLDGLIAGLYPRLAASEPTRAFDRMAQSQGAGGTPQVDRSRPDRVVTTFTPEQTRTGRPVIDVDMLDGEHAVDGDIPGNTIDHIIRYFTGRKLTNFDSTQYLIDTMLKYRKES